LSVRLDDLFPPIDTGRQIHEVVAELMRQRPPSADFGVPHLHLPASRSVVGLIHCSTMYHR
jgi:hypothetical protein